MEFRPYPAGHGKVVILAGAEGSYFRKLMISMGAKACLLSYYYLRLKLKDGQETMQDILNDLKEFDFVYLDSGGHTLRLAVEEGKLNISLLDFVKEYYAFCREYRHYFTVFGAVDAYVQDTEFDFDTMVEWYFKAPTERIHVAPTLLVEMSLSAWRKVGVYQQFDYVAYNVAARANKFRGEMRQHLLTAQRNKVRTHGYAMTKQEDFRALNFSSVDSLTWLGGQKYGSTYVFRAGKMRTYGLDYKLKIRRRLVNVCRKYNIDFAEVMKDNYKEVNKLNLVAWKELDEYYRVAGKRLAYWLKTGSTIMDMEGNIISEQKSGEELLGSLEDTTIPIEPLRIEAPEMQAPAPMSDSPEDRALLSRRVRGVMPMRCDTCLISDRCGKAQPGANCSLQFSELFNVIQDTTQALPESANAIMQLQYDRIVRASAFEKADGGALDPQLSSEISRYFSMLHSLKSLGEKPKSSLTLTATGGAADAAAGGGILQGMLAQLMK